MKSIKPTIQQRHFEEATEFSFTDHASMGIFEPLPEPVGKLMENLWNCPKAKLDGSLSKLV